MSLDDGSKKIIAKTHGELNERVNNLLEVMNAPLHFAEFADKLDPTEDFINSDVIKKLINLSRIRAKEICADLIVFIATIPDLL